MNYRLIANSICVSTPLLIGWHALPFGSGSISAAELRDKAAGAILFSESFNDARLLSRGWYDGGRFTIGDEARQR